MHHSCWYDKGGVNGNYSCEECQLEKDLKKATKMIKLSNGYCYDMGCAAGAFGFLNGWWWERPLCWTGILRPQDWTITTKSLTMSPIKGNLKIWWPFNLYRNCVQTFHDGVNSGTVNAVGMTNPSLPVWIRDYYPKVQKLGLNVIVNVIPYTVEEAEFMGMLLDDLKDIKGVELNLSCPSCKKTESDPYDLVKALKSNCKHPLGIKLGYSDDFNDNVIVKDCENYIEFVTLINCVKWEQLYPNTPSPLAPYGLTGGVSGAPIRSLARASLAAYKASGLKVPVVSCGGIESEGEAYSRFVMGANAIQIGVKIKNDPIGAQKMFDSIVSNIRK